MFNNYGPLCTAVYELTKPVGSTLNGDLDYYLERLDETKGTILEAGVGTGRMLIPLLEAGHEVYGIDASAPMLAQCRQNCTQAGFSPTLFQADLDTFQLDTRFAAIIMPTSTFCLIPTETLALAVLKNLYQHLLPGGRLIFDLDLPFYPELGEVTTNTYPLSATSGITLESKTVAIDWLQQHIVSHLRYEKWEQGQLLATELQELTLRWYGLSELKLLLTALGFQNITLSADYEFNEMPSDSNQTITFEAQK